MWLCHELTQMNKFIRLCSAPSRQSIPCSSTEKWDTDKLIKAQTKILLDFSLTVKAATLIFISGRGSAIPSAKEGKSGFICNLSIFVPSKRACIS